MDAGTSIAHTCICPVSQRPFLSKSRSLSLPFLAYPQLKCKKKQLKLSIRLSPKGVPKFSCYNAYPKQRFRDSRLYSGKGASTSFPNRRKQDFIPEEFEYGHPRDYLKEFIEEGRNPWPRPPEGFTLDSSGTVCKMAPPENRVTVIMDPDNGLPLECVIRRRFTNSRGQICWLLCPLDMPLKIWKFGDDGIKSLDEDKVEEVLPAAAYALAKINMHLVFSGFCLTARGPFCYSEGDIQQLEIDDVERSVSALQDVIQIANFEVEDSDYAVYTPVEPLFFVATKDESGKLKMVEEEFYEDDLVLDAIDEEKEFQALVEEEKALIEALMEDD